MRKSKFTLFLATLFLGAGLVGCSSKENQSVKIVLEDNENVTMTTTLDNSKLFEGMEGDLIVTPLNHYKLLGVNQKVGKEEIKLFSVYGAEDTYPFTLKAGINKFIPVLSDTPVYGPTKLVLPKVEHAKVSTSLDNETEIQVGTYGEITVEVDKGYKLVSIKQNKTIELSRLENTVNTFTFYVEPEINTFDIVIESTESLPKATLTLPKTEEVTVTSTFDEKTMREGDRGVITCEMNKKRYVKNFKMNDEVINPATYNTEGPIEATYIVTLKAGENKVTFDTFRKEATLRVVENDKVSKVISSLDTSKTWDAKDEGTLEIFCVEDHLVSKVVQNDIFEIEKDTTANKSNVYKFQLLEGENFFTIYTSEFHNEYNPDKPLIEGSNNKPSMDGTLSDDVDEIPSQGGLPPIPLPDYGEGTKTIFFRDKEWWKKDAASTNIVCYNSAKEQINSTDELGIMMRHMEYIQAIEANNWKMTISADTAYVKFIRTGKNGTENWGAETDLLAVPNFTEYNGYVLTFNGTEAHNGQWKGNGEFASAELFKL